MKPKHKKHLQDLISFKINLSFIIIFAVAISYAAEMLTEAAGVKEILFLAAIMLILVDKLLKPMTRIMDLIEEFLTRDKGEEK